MAKKNEFWLLHNPEDWVLLVLGAAGVASLLSNIDFGPAFAFSWPAILIVISIRRIMKAHQTGKY